MTVMALSLIVGGIVGLFAFGGDSINQAAGLVIIISVVVYQFAFGVSWGYGAWLYIPEITPLRVRGKAVGLCTAVNWGPANVASAFLTPAMISGPPGPGGALLFFGGVSMIAVPFVL